MIAKEEVGRRLRAARKAAGKSLREVAEAVGMTESNLSKIERGQTATTTDRLYDISAYLGLAGDWLSEVTTAQSEIDPELRAALRQLDAKGQRRVLRVLKAMVPKRPLEQAA